MNRSKRDQAVRVFMSKDKARVMLMSLKCGGVSFRVIEENVDSSTNNFRCWSQPDSRQ
jgi:hypothetical protein